MKDGHPNSIKIQLRNLSHTETAGSHDARQAQAIGK